MEARSYDPGLELTGSGPGLVLIPGIAGSDRMFYRQVPDLAREHRVATYALRDDATSMAQLVDDLTAIVHATTSARATGDTDRRATIIV